MEARLVPVNAFIALCTSGDVWPAPLAQAGYRLAGLEVGVAVGDGTVVVDGVAFRPSTNAILAGEAKSGANVEEEQARRYADLDADALVRAANVTVARPGPRTVQAVYVCMAENTERILLGLEQAGVQLPVLAVSDESIQHHGAAFDDSDLDTAFSAPLPARARRRATSPSTSSRPDRPSTRSSPPRSTPRSAAECQPSRFRPSLKRRCDTYPCSVRRRGTLL